MDSETILCPSSNCLEGAILVGIVMPDGRVAYASDRIVVNEDFVQAAREGRSPEKRFRFSTPCLKGGCAQWAGERCGVIDRVLAEGAGDSASPELPACSIRPQCRWFQQSGAAACAACPEVVTDGRVEVEAAPALATA